MDIDFYACPAEEVSYPDSTFDVITVCQCIWYLKAEAIAGKSEEIILKHNPNRSSYGDTVHPH